MNIDMERIDVNCAKCGRRWTARIAHIQALRIVVCARCEAAAQTGESKETPHQNEPMGINYPNG
jgi:DNA-directed RNA polymerase subunit RPC12/RpoP